MQKFTTCAKELMRSYRKVFWRTQVNIVTGLVEIAAALSFVWVSKHLVDLAANKEEGIWHWIIVLISIRLIQLACGVFSGWWTGLTSVKNRNHSRAEVFSRLMNSVWDGSDRHHTGDLVNRLEGDVDTVSDFCCNNLPTCILTLCRLVAAWIFLYNLAPKLAAILILVMPLAALSSAFFFKQMRRLTGEIRKQDSLIQSHMQENLQHRILSMAMGSTPLVLSKLYNLQDTVLSKTKSRLRYSAIARTLMNIGFGGGYILCFAWGVVGLRDGTVSYGLMVAFLQLVGQVQNPVFNLTMQIPNFINALSSQERLSEFDDLEQEQAAQPVTVDGAPGIRICGLSYGYPESQNGSDTKPRKVLDKLDFDFKPGAMTLITGPTGAGKSTLIKLMLSIMKPSEGKIELYSANIKADASPATRCNFMYVPQGNTLMSGSIRDNLLLSAPDASDAELLDALHVAAADFVADLPQGLDTNCTESGGGLSEGQAQRICIARALLKTGGIMILDEATSALDSDTEQTLLERLSERFRGSKTIICITHRPAAAAFAENSLSLQGYGKNGI